MAYPAVKLLVLLVSCLTVLGAELDTLSWPDSGPQLLAQTPAQPPVNQGTVKSDPPSQAPVQPHPPSQAPVQPHPPSQAPVQSHPPSQAPVQSHPPSQAPVQPHPPSQAPVQPHPPSQSPVQPHPPSPAPNPVPKRSFVAVQGVVYCKPCELSGIDSLLNATPLLGAVVKLQCNNTKYPQSQEAKTDKNGYFFLMGPKSVTTYGSHKCKVSLGSSPQPKCSKPTNLHNGLQGALLEAQNQPNLSEPRAYQLFTVGPFAFEPATKCAP